MRNIKYVIKDIPYKLRKIKWAFERATKGYTTWDIMGSGFDETHAKYIGHSLLYMADNICSYLGRAPYDEPERWITDLKKHGQALVNLSTEINFTQKESTYYGSISFVPDDMGSRVVFPPKSDEVLADIKARNELENKRHEEASAALHWIADWHGSLWD